MKHSDYFVHLCDDELRFLSKERGGKSFRVAVQCYMQFFFLSILFRGLAARAAVSVFRGLHFGWRWNTTTVLAD